MSDSEAMIDELEKEVEKLEEENCRLDEECGVLTSKIIDLEEERDRLREALESAQHALKRASGLYSLGYNERHAEDQPDHVDETGISRKQYEQEAGRLCVMLSRTRDVVERALWPDSATNQIPSPCCEGDGCVIVTDNDGEPD